MADEIVWTTADGAEAANIALRVTELRKLLHGKNHERRCCVIFDVDHTLIVHREPTGEFAAHPVGKRIYTWAVSQEIDIILVTARRKSEDARDYLQRQLRAADYDTSFVTAVYMLPSEYEDDDDGGARFKRNTREIITKTHCVVCNCGDRWGDVSSNDEPEDVDLAGLYAGIFPSEKNVLHCLKFPEED